MKKSIVEKNILSRDFAYLQPWFYDHPYAMRCELGIGDDNDEYLRAAKRRAMEIYHLLFPNGADAANYHRLEPYFPDRDRELMKTRYREATEELPKTEDSPNERR